MLETLALFFLLAILVPLPPAPRYDLEPPDLYDQRTPGEYVRTPGDW